MPTYEFKCGRDHVTTRFLQMKDVVDVVPCDHCDLGARRQIASGGGVIFKGPGFYCNDKKDKR